MDEQTDGPGGRGERDKTKQKDERSAIKQLEWSE